MSRLKKPYFRKTEVEIEVTIQKEGKQRILSFNKPVLAIQLSEDEAHSIGWHLDPKSRKRGFETK